MSAAGHFVLFLSLLLNIQEAGVSLKSRLSAPECATHGEPQHTTNRAPHAGQAFPSMSAASAHHHHRVTRVVCD